jgi:hypothetical protein
MASVVQRSDGRFELRESVSTPDGPRSRTLAIFRELTREVLDHARERAQKPFDEHAVVAQAQKLGLHVKELLGSDETARFIARVQASSLWPTHVRAVLDSVGSVVLAPLPDHLEPMVEWMGADDERRGRALVDLLGLTHAIVRNRPSTRTEPLRFPRLTAAR